jgi:acetyl esterase/lipase
VAGHPDFTSRRVVHEIPGMDAVVVERDLPYATVGSRTLRFDRYLPPEPRGRSVPVVVFVHGDAPPDVLEHAKDWGAFVSWGRLAAASGLASVTFDHRSSQGRTRLEDSAADVDALLRCLRTRGPDLGLDADRMCLWVCSAGPPHVLPSILRDPPPWVRCVVAYYGLMDLVHIRAQIPEAVSDEELKRFSPLVALRTAGRRPPPMLLVRAGLDEPRFNDSIDAFVAEAVARDVELDLLTHPAGHHSFDVVDDDARSRDIVARTLEFMGRHLRDEVA